MAGQRVTPGQKKKYFTFRAEGSSIAVSAQRAGFSESTALRFERQTRINPEWTPNKEAAEMLRANRLRREAVAESKLPGPVPLDRLNPEAKRALEDFDYFRRRYFGRISMPWQILAANDLVQLLHTDEREFVDLNEPPGSGKSTLLTDFKAWLICRDRTVRVLTGSATQSLARRQLMRLRRSLERMVPLTADPKDIARGVAIDAESTLPKDFGRFKPTDKELWNQDAFIVMQHEGMGAIEDKEATCTAYGIDTEFTGGRFDYVEWDDLVSPKSVGSAQYREDLESIYVKTCEARVEPSGLMVLSGQRLAADDLHRFVLDMVRPPEDEDDELDEDEVREAIEQGDRSNMKYRHIVFKAHYEDRCKNEHTKASKPFPDGCLLDPRRLPWRDLASAQANNPSEYSLVYQQEDADPAQALVKREWVYGDENHLGCVDYDRDQWELPEGVSFHDCVVFATADPSPTMYWSVQAWCYHEPSKSMILLAHVRKKMRMPEMLDRDIHGNYTGIMEEWRKISDRIGFPIGTWIVEHNAAQRFMLQQSLLRDWRLVHGVEVRPHSTTMNKADPHYGVWTMANLWRLGRVRLPMRDGDARMSSMKLIEEVLVYDHGRTDDCVMAMWMGHWNLPDLALPEDTSTDIERPSWVLEAAF